MWCGALFGAGVDVAGVASRVVRCPVLFGTLLLYYVCSLYVETYLTGPRPDTGGYAKDINGREARADIQGYMAALKRRKE